MNNEERVFLDIYGGAPGEFLASVASRVEGFFYRCLNDTDYTMLRVSSGFERVFGHPAAEFVREGRSFADLIHPEDLPGVVAALDEAIKNDSNWVITYRLRQGKKRYRRVLESGGAARDARTGEVTHLDGVILDAQRLT